MMRRKGEKEKAPVPVHPHHMTIKKWPQVSRASKCQTSGPRKDQIISNYALLRPQLPANIRTTTVDYPDVRHVVQEHPEDGWTHQTETR